MSARACEWAWRQEPKTTSQKLVLMAMADRADEEGVCWPSIQWIATKCAPMTTETVRRCIRELTDQGFVEKVERNRRPDGTLGTWNYRLTMSSVDESPVEPVGTGARADLDLPDGRSEAKASESLKAANIRLVTNTWSQHAPPLIQHQQKVLTGHEVTAAIQRALRVYDATVIAEAIANYAAVLGGDEFRWSHSWTLRDFLKRGLDRFVPEARPLENFRIRASGEKFGRRDVSAREFEEAARRLEAEQADERRALEPG